MWRIFADEIFGWLAVGSRRQETIGPIRVKHLDPRNPRFPRSEWPEAFARCSVIHDALPATSSRYPSRDMSLDEDFPLGDGTADVEAVVTCPYCGEPGMLTLDPG